MPEVEKNQPGKVPIGDTVHDIEILKDNEVPEDDTRRNEGTFAQPEFHRQVPNDSEHHHLSKTSGHQDGEPAKHTYGATNMDDPNLKRHQSNSKSMDSLLPVRSSKRRRKAKVVRSSDDDDAQEEEEQNTGKNRQDNSGSGEGSNVPNSTLAACTEGGGHAGGRHHDNNHNRSTDSMPVSALSAENIATSPQLDRNATDESNKHEVGRKKIEEIGGTSGGRNDGDDGKEEQGAGREKKGKSNTMTNGGSDESRDGQKLKNKRSITPAVPPPLSIPCAATAAPGQVSNINNNSKSIPAEQVSHVDFISAAKAAQQLSNLQRNFSAIQAQFVGQIQTIIKTTIGGGPSPPDLDVGAMLRACSKAHEIIQSVAYKPAAGMEVNVAAATAPPPSIQPPLNLTSLLVPSLPLPPSTTTVSPVLQQQPLSAAPPAAAAAAAGGVIFPPLPPTQQFPYGYAPGNNASRMGGKGGGGGGGTGTGLPLPLQHYQQQPQSQQPPVQQQQQQIHRNLQQQQQQQVQQPHLLNHNINMSLVGSRGNNNNNNIRIRRGNAPTFTGFMPTPHEEPPRLFTGASGGGERRNHGKGGW